MTVPLRVALVSVRLVAALVVTLGAGVGVGVAVVKVRSPPVEVPPLFTATIR